MEKEVRIGELGGALTTYVLDNGDTCQELADKAEIETDGKVFRIGGQKVDGSHKPSNGDLVLVVKESKGGY